MSLMFICSLVHVSLATVVGCVGEQKSKPTQHSVRELRAAGDYFDVFDVSFLFLIGLMPNMIVMRSTDPLTRSVREKVSLYSMVPSSHVFSTHDVENIYRVYMFYISFL